MVYLWGAELPMPNGFYGVPQGFLFEPRLFRSAVLLLPLTSPRSDIIMRARLCAPEHCELAAEKLTVATDTSTGQLHFELWNVAS